MHRRFVVLLLLAVLAAAPAAVGQSSGPDAPVRAMLEGLKSGAMAQALEAAGLPLPAEVAPFLAGVPLPWRVTSYEILDVQTDGGLARVRVRETSQRDPLPVLQDLAEDMPALVAGLKTGEVTVENTFVVVRLDGRWQLDPYFSGVRFQDLPMPSMANPRLDETQQKAIADLVNGTGLGRAVASLSAGAPTAAVLAAVLVPNFVRARAQGQLTACKSNLKNLGTALEMWSTDNSGRYPGELGALTPDYLRTLPTCPAAGTDTYTASYQKAVNPDAFTVFCSGLHHAEAGAGEDRPQYNSLEGLVP